MLFRLCINLLPAVRPYSVCFDAAGVADPSEIGAISFVVVCFCHKPLWLLACWLFVFSLKSLPDDVAEPATFRTHHSESFVCFMQAKMSTVGPSYSDKI